MAQIRSTKEIFNTSTASTSDWVATTNGKYDEGKVYSVTLDITAGDTVVIELTNDVDSSNVVAASPKVTQSDALDSTVTGQTIAGTWAYMRAVKTGTNGTAVVLVAM